MLYHPCLNKKTISTIESEINRKLGKIYDLFNFYVKGEISET